MPPAQRPKRWNLPAVGRVTTRYALPGCGPVRRGAGSTNFIPREL